MKGRAEKTSRQHGKRSQGNAVANVAQSKGKSDSGTHYFADNRAEAGSMEQFQAMVDASSQHTALQTYVDMTNTVDSGVIQEKEDSQAQRAVLQQKENHTGLPDSLKGGLESLSGMSLNHVKVHYNSSKPAQLNAHAYTQGTDIHVAPGQEKHLAHEGWHVVQQAAGRVAPTTQLAGTPVNDSQGLEAEADHMGTKAEALGATVQRVTARDALGAMPVEVLAGKGSSVAQLAGKKVQVKNATHLVEKNDGSIYKSEGLGQYVKFGDVIKIDTDTYLNSRRGPHQEISKNRQRDKTGEHRYKWFKVLKLNGAPVISDYYLRDGTFFDDIDAGIMNKAHGSGTAKEVTENQTEYQNWLKDSVPMSRIMDSHRSVGFEYEFATYSNKKNSSPGLAAHIELGKSEVISPLFSSFGSFVLETDSSDEIEAVTPPLLIKDDGENMNKNAAKNIYELYHQSLKNLRDDNKTESLSNRKLSNLKEKLKAAGLGGGWEMTNKSDKLYLSADRKKHGGSVDSIYSQMNISLTPDEISEFTGVMAENKREMRDRYIADNRPYASATRAIIFATISVNDLFVPKVEDAIDEYFQPPRIGAIEPATESGLKSARINISKGLAGLAAIPSILASNEGIKSNSAIHSNVKEACGIWLKDSIPNIVDNSLKDEASREIMRMALEEVKTSVREKLEETVDADIAIIKDGVKDYYKWSFKRDNKTNTKLAAYKATFRAEYNATIVALEQRLAEDGPKRENVEAPEYGKESFEGSGQGVRKDTFVNIASGRNRKMHLAEIRNDYAIKKLLQ